MFYRQTSIHYNISHNIIELYHQTKLSVKLKKKDIDVQYNINQD